MKAAVSTFHLSLLRRHSRERRLVRSWIILWVVGGHGPPVSMHLLLGVEGVLTLLSFSHRSMDDPIVLCGYGKRTFFFHRLMSHSPPQTSAFGVFQDYYTSTYMPHASASAISWIGGVQIFLELILGPIGGWLYVLLLISKRHVSSRKGSSVDNGYIRAANIAGCSLFTLRSVKVYQLIIRPGIDPLSPSFFLLSLAQPGQYYQVSFLGPRR